MSDSTYPEWNNRFQRFFRPAYREIEILDRKINRKDGLLIFKWHKYTTKELLDSEHHAKINSVTEKIGDNLTNWYKRSELPEVAKPIYERHKYNLDERLHDTNLKIYDRKPTWLERAKGILERFVEIVRENMPLLVRNLLESAAIYVFLEISCF